MIVSFIQFLTRDIGVGVGLGCLAPVAIPVPYTSELATYTHTYGRQDVGGTGASLIDFSHKHVSVDEVLIETIKLLLYNNIYDILFMHS